MTTSYNTMPRLRDTELDNYQRYNEEEEWALDDAQEKLRARYSGNSGLQRHHDLGAPVPVNPGPSLPVASGSLPYPIIIPQRRPGQRDRGFIRAYAPDLMSCGIDVPTFMGFLDELDKATASCPYVSAINLASNAAGFLPSGIGTAVTLTVKITAGVYQEMRSRKNQNAFLLKMNDELFRPRGLYCFIMAYNPESNNALVQEDLSAATSNTRSEFRSNDGITGPIEFPASAELVFPDLEDTSSDEEEGESGTKSFFSKLIDSYNERKDLKAQRKYLRKNPTGALNPLMDPKVELTRKDHKRQLRRLEKDERKHERRERRQERRARRHPERAEKEPRKRFLRKDIMYMMIINMPSMQEMENAARLVENPPR
ncbi:hypothetical protein F5Y00DRAFT_235870 [Daldinia vernicosa]|uniref:uncharacterized protein n=1 Tax=Daldinia vernicosa TaxID=114800 RepID=UPI00200845D6|nr:uncharacterized protein F5Y00DRAFT_235870 [Daldinia vernicosa]KAI0849184.1 hypothetical protein F5Y00DRAFT_235870 [Daldinia vernicosa]